jgi:hypothetical protein
MLSIKTTIIHSFTPVKIAIEKDKKNKMLAREPRKGNSHGLFLGM